MPRPTIVILPRGLLTCPWPMLCHYGVGPCFLDEYSDYAWLQADLSRPPPPPAASRWLLWRLSHTYEPLLFVAYQDANQTRVWKGRRQNPRTELCWTGLYVPASHASPWLLHSTARIAHAKANIACYWPNFHQHVRRVALSSSEVD